MDKDFIRKLLTRACCPALIHEVYSCQWDKETKVLTTPGEEEERENCADIDSTAWYREQVGEHMMDNKKKSKRQYEASEALYDLYGEQYEKTFHKRNDHCYVGSPGAATLDLSKNQEKIVFLEDYEDEEDDMSEVSNLSREALIDLIRK